MTKKLPQPDQFLFYQIQGPKIRVQVRLSGNTVWLSLTKMAELFDRDKSVISKHILNILSEGELEKRQTVAKFATVQREGSRTVERLIEYYNLDMILAVGYRVRSPRGIQFRRWATTVLKEYLVKGFAMDDDRLKQAEKWDYFDEWLERIRDIRASEKRFYQKVRDIYATAIDYDKKSEQAKAFFKQVQNKMLWAITGKTAAELIMSRSDSKKPNMGLTTWRSSRVHKEDVVIAKNYLGKKEISDLNRIVTMYLDYAEDQAHKRQTITMKQWNDKLSAFLKFNERELLTHAGSVTAEVAKKLVEDRYDEFSVKRRKAEALSANQKDLKEIEQLLRKVKKNLSRGKNK